MIEPVAKEAVTMHFIHDIVFYMGFALWLLEHNDGILGLGKWLGLGLMIKDRSQKAKLQYLRTQCNLGLICEGVQGFSPAW